MTDQRTPAEGNVDEDPGDTGAKGLSSKASALVWDRRLRLAVLLVAGFAMLGLLLFVGRWLSFWYDEWNFIFDRQSLTTDAVLAPHVDTLVAVPSLVYQGLIGAFGLRTYLPFLLVAWLSHFVCVVLIYRIVSRRSGPLLGTIAALSLLFLGSAYEVLLQPFQVVYLFAAVGGLIAIDRILVSEGRPDASRTTDLIVAAVALVIAVLSSSVGPITVGLVIVWALLSRDRPALATTAPSILIYGAWYLTWGRQSQGLFVSSGPDPIQSGGATLYGIGAAVGGVLGLPPERFALFGLAIGLVVVIGLATARVRFGPLAIAALAALVAEYGLAALFRGSFGIEHAARSGYIYPAAIFLWLAISGLVGGGLSEATWRGRRRFEALPLIIALLIIPMIIGNMRQFVGAAQASRALRATELGVLRLMEAARDEPGMALDISPDPTIMPQVTARQYLAAVDRFGAPDLDWDWSAGVDTAAVNAAAVRLFSAAATLDAVSQQATAGPAVEVSHGTASQSTEASCVVVRPTATPTSVTWGANDRAIWTRGVVADRSIVLVGVTGEPSATLDGGLNTAFLSGRPLRLPRIASAYPWRVTVRTDSERPFEVCAAPVAD